MMKTRLLALVGALILALGGTSPAFAATNSPYVDQGAIISACQYLATAQSAQPGDGYRNLQCDSSGNLKVTGGGGGGGSSGTIISSGADGTSNSTSSQAVSGFNYLYNGSTWDRAPGTAANGAYSTLKQGGNTLSSSNAIPSSVTNGSGTTAGVSALSSDGNAAGSGLVTNSQGLLFNGTTWDRATGSAANGAYETVKQGGNALSSTNGLPVQLNDGTANISATEPLGVQLSVSNTAAAAANPVPVQLSQGNAVLSSTNGLPTTWYGNRGNTTGTISALNGSVTVTNMNGYEGLTYQISGTFNETFALEYSDDGSTWSAITDATGSSSFAISAARASTVTVAPHYQFRIRCSSYTSGSASVTLIYQYSTGAKTVTGNVGGKTAQVSVTPTVTSGSAYAAGNEVGGLLTFSNAFLTANSGALQSLHLQSKSVQTAGFKIYLFRANPSNTTWTDKTTPSMSASDLPNLIGVYSLSAADSGLGTMSIYNLDGIGKYIAASGTTLYGVLVTTGTPTFTSTSDLNIVETMGQD